MESQSSGEERAFGANWETSSASNSNSFKASRFPGFWAFELPGFWGTLGASTASKTASRLQNFYTDVGLLGQIEILAQLQTASRLTEFGEKIGSPARSPL